MYIITCLNVKYVWSYDGFKVDRSKLVAFLYVISCVIDNIIKEYI
jgi:hypothetical protein